MAKMTDEQLGAEIGSDKELKFFLKRKKQLEKHRVSAHGVNLEDLMRTADRDYELRPLNRLRPRSRDWNRGENLRLQENRVNLKTGEDWQSDNSDATVFSKIQTALAMLFDRNPSAVLYPKSKRYVANTELARAIFQDSQEREKFKHKLKLFVLNMSKFGWAYGRTIIKETERTFKDLIEVNPVTGERKYKEKTDVKRRIDFRTLNNWNVWVDDRARPYQMDTIHDWMWREVYTDEEVYAEFGKDAQVKKAVANKDKEVLDIKQTNTASDVSIDEQVVRRDVNEVYFYENMDKDRVIVVVNGLKVYSEILPSHKKLSLVTTFWNLRSDLSIYGVGIPEILRQDKNLLDKIRNMSVDQLVLSIYKMFFYDGAYDSEDSQIRIRPGMGQRVFDPAKLKWLEVPSGGSEAYSREELLRGNMEESTGISKALSGSVVADPNIKALAIQQAKEAALAKMKTPLENILEALENEASLRWALIQELNMFPDEVEKIIEPGLAEEYLAEIEHNKELYHYDDNEHVLYALRYPEIAANLKQGADGVYRPSQEKMFFMVTPEKIRWNGEIRFSAESLLVTNKELQKQMDLDMANLIIPLFTGDPALNLKPAKQILKIYDKDEEDWLPDSWLHPEAAPVVSQPPGTPTMGPQPQEQSAPSQGLDTVVPRMETQPGAGTTDIVNKLTAQTR